MSFRIDAGDYRFVEGEPYCPVERRYRCRLQMDGAGSGEPYYGVLVCEVPLVRR